MQFAPQAFVPSVWGPLNGQLPSGVHATEVDTFATWLATRRMPIPPSVGAPMNGQTYTEFVHVNQTSEHLAFIILAAGAGDLDISCDDDSHDIQIKITGGGSTRSHASYYHVNQVIKTVSTNTMHRAFNLTDENIDSVVSVTFTVPADVYIFEIIPYVLPRSYDSLLP